MRFAWAAMVAGVAGALLFSGCGKTVDGTALPLGDSAAGSHPDFAKLNQECRLVDGAQIGKIVGGEVGEPSFIGAICRWNGTGPAGNVKITLNWFESGSLRNERTTNEKLNYQITDISVSGRKAIQEKRPNDADSCGVTVGAFDTGIIGWWVQYNPGTSHADPCDQAKKLAEASLNLSR